MTGIKRLTSRENGAPLLVPVAPEKCRNLPGSAYVSAAEIERFKAKYLTSGLVGREFGINSASARRTLKQAGIVPVVDPALLKTFVYLREDVLSVASVFTAHQPLTARDQNETCQTMAAEQTFDESNKSGESDASSIAAVKSNHHKNRGFGSKIVKVMLHYTVCWCCGPVVRLPSATPFCTAPLNCARAGGGKIHASGRWQRERPRRHSFGRV